MKSMIRVIRGIQYNAWVLIAVFILALLFTPGSSFLLLSKPQSWELFSSQHALMLLLIYCSALVMVALFLYVCLKLIDQRQDGEVAKGEATQRQQMYTGKEILLVFVLGSLLLARALYDLYWFMVWDATTDPLEYFWMVIPVPVVLLSGTVLCIVLPGKKKLAGFLYSLLIIALMIGVSAWAQHVDYRKLTEERAERITQGIEKYFVREGHYPQTLQQLTPWYLVSLTEPVIIYGQRWCYQAGEDYYTLGYLDREHWSSPILFGHVYSAQGHSALKEDVCQQEIDTFRTQHSNWNRVLQDYGRSTPTLDFGQ